MYERLKKRKLFYKRTVEAYEEALRVRREELKEAKIHLADVREIRKREEDCLGNLQVHSSLRRSASPFLC